MNIEINEALSIKVKEVVSHGLCKGLGNPIPGEMCIEAAVNYACGFEHGDDPICVGSAVRSFKITLNDADWSSNAARAEGMKKIAMAQLGSNTIDQVAFAKIVAFKTITILMPVILRDNKLESEAVLCEKSKDLKEAKINIRIARDNIYAAAYSAAAYAAYDAYAADTYGYAAYDAAANAAYVAGAAAFGSGDKYLLISANICLEALVELKSPGCEFLYLYD